MYRSLGGIAPASPGYATVTIAPQISPTLDPASANATVRTVRGVVASSWHRHDGHICVDGQVEVVTLQVAVPVGMLGDLRLPLLGRAASQVSVGARDVGASATEKGELSLWAAGAAVADVDQGAGWLRRAARVEGVALALGVAAAELQLVVREAC
jgi:hypothetical protein